ncbi:MAG: hypothetical protein ACRESZ_03020, partial [Methylococcales bacterium]
MTSDKFRNPKLRVAKIFIVTADARRVGALPHLEPVQDLAEGRIAALKSNSKCSHTSCMLRILLDASLRLAPAG